MLSMFGKHKHHVELLVMLVIFIVFFGVGMLLLGQQPASKKMNDEGVTNNAKDMTQKTPAGAWYKVVADPGEHNVGDTINLVVKGDSNNAAIEGYDVLFPYDPRVEIVDVKSITKDFQAYTFRNPGYLSITSTKLLTVKEPSIFDNEDLLTISVKVNQPGTYTFGVAVEKGKEKSKMVDSTATIIKPSVVSTTVKVK